MSKHKGSWTDAAKGGNLTRKHRRALAAWIRNSGVCHLCGEKIPHPIDEYELMNKDNRLTLDHLLPKSMGGTYRSSNILPAHRKCNLARGAQCLTRLSA